MLALGGALGGVLVGLVAPNVFNDLYELPLGMVALCIFVDARAAARPREPLSRALGQSPRDSSSSR